MSYTKTTWVTGDIVTAPKLNNLENGVYNNDQKISELEASESTLQGNIAAPYDATATYAVGDYCIHEGQLQRCIVPIETAEAWTASHWTAVAMGDEVGDLRSAIGESKSLPQLYDDLTKYTYPFGTGRNAVCLQSIPAGVHITSLEFYSVGQQDTANGFFFLIDSITNDCLYIKYIVGAVKGWNKIPLDYITSSECYFAVDNIALYYTNSGVTEEYAYSTGGLAYTTPETPEIGLTMPISKVYSGTFALSAKINYATAIKAEIDLIENKLEQSNYSRVITADGMRHNIRIKNLGKLKYLQSFCIYNGHYFSTNGSRVAEQDEAFADLRDVEIDLGHGNAMQVNEKLGVAYVSGGTYVYVLDLETLTITETINLNQTVFSTAVIDYNNKIAYIINTSEPDASVKADYNLIAYDYINNTVIFTKNIGEYYAVQAMDFYQGKILFNYGFNATSGGTGTIVLNTNGDVLAKFYIDELKTHEPEGIQMDRNDNGYIYVSRYERDIYQISTIV